MTKLRHENPPHWGPDPGAVRSVPDTAKPWTPPAERQKRAAEREARRRELVQRSKERDFELLVAPARADAQRRHDLGLPLSPWDELSLALSKRGRG